MSVLTHTHTWCHVCSLAGAVACQVAAQLVKGEERA